MDNVFLLFSFLGVKWNMVKMFTGLHKTSSSSNTFGIDQVDQFIKVTGGEKKSSQSWDTHTPTACNFHRDKVKCFAYNEQTSDVCP